MSEQNEIFFKFGDLVRVDGYWPRVFKVDGYRREHWQYPDEEWTDVVYELHDVGDLEFIEADMADLTLVETADKADAYLETNPPHYEAPAQVKPDWMTFMFGEEEKAMNGFGEKAKEPRKPTARELSAKEAEERKAARKEREAQINNLLEIAQWNRKMLEKTNDESYGDRLFAVEAELMKLVETE